MSKKVANITKDKGFAKTFWTPYNEEKASKRIGQPFKVLGEKPKEDFDYPEVGPMYLIQFEDGEKLEAFPEEILAENQSKIKTKMEDGTYG